MTQTDAHMRTYSALEGLELWCLATRDSHLSQELTLIRQDFELLPGYLELLNKDLI